MTDATVKAWRREKRAELLAMRQAMPVEERQRATQLVVARLGGFVATRKYTTIGLYWPIKLEINLLPWADALAREFGTILCLPVVVAQKTPLEYWRWSQGEPLDRGFWDIPIPARREVVVPDLMLAPLVGFDSANYRLGYGGGYFDRTLASLGQRPMVVGVGHDFSALKTIFPQPYDIPMDAVVTERRDTFPPRKAHDDG
jgi:5,10-methenyltetrahydrofolate synthetase